MTHIALLGARVKGIYDYVDAARVWFPEPQSERVLRDLNANSGGMRRARQLHISEPAWWDRRFKQVIALYQPRNQAIEILAEIDGAHLTDIEIAHDQILASQERVDRWLQDSREHFVQRRQENRHVRIWANGNWRSADLHRVVVRCGQEIRQRKLGTVFQAYGDRPCKITGELNCAHLEAKIYGSSALRRVGIYDAKDLLHFDYKSFWHRYFHMYDLDRERLGRWYVNQTKNSRLQSSPKSKSGYNEHRSIGNLLCRVVGRDRYGNFSVQRLVDEFGRGPFLNKLPLSAYGVVVFEKAKTFPLVAETTLVVCENLQ